MMDESIKLLYGYNNGNGQLIRLISQNITKNDALSLLAGQIEAESGDAEKVFKAINDIAIHVMGRDLDNETGDEDHTDSDFSILWNTDLLRSINSSVQSIQNALDLYKQIEQMEGDSIEVFIA